MDCKIFLDTNIFLDHLEDRNANSVELIKLCESGEADGYASSASFYTLAYFVRKYAKVKVNEILKNYTSLVNVIPTSKSNLFDAYQSDFSDLEDAFQYFTARNEPGVDYFVTNNLSDFRRTDKKLKVVSAKEMLTILKNESE